MFSRGVLVRSTFWQRRQTYTNLKSTTTHFLILTQKEFCSQLLVWSKNLKLRIPKTSAASYWHHNQCIALSLGLSVKKKKGRNGRRLKYWPRCCLCCLHLQIPCLLQLRFCSSHHLHSRRPDYHLGLLMTRNKTQMIRKPGEKTKSLKNCAAKTGYNFL